MKQYVFWHYDLYPHVLWAEVDKIEDGKIHPKGWQNMYLKFNKVLTLLGEIEGLEYINKLTHLKQEREDALKEFEVKAKSILKDFDNKVKQIFKD